MTRRAETAAPGNRSRSANTLRAAREARGVSPEDASREARIPTRYLRMLEEGEFPTVADPAYLTHFLRRYAVSLGLDAESIARDFLSETEPDTAARRRGRKPSETAPERPRLAIPAWAMYGAVLVASLIGLFSLARFQQEREATTVAAVASPRGETRAAAGPVVSPPVEAEARDSDGESVDQAAAPVDRIEAPAAPVDRIDAPAAPVEAIEAPAAPVGATGAPAAPEAAVLRSEALVPPGEAIGAEPGEGIDVRAAQSEAAPQSDRPVTSPLARSSEPEAPDAPGAPLGRLELRLTATSRQVWVWVSIDDGPREAISLSRGDTIELTARQGFLISMDDAGGIDATLNGTPLPRFGANAQALRNLAIPGPERGPFGAGGSPAAG